MHNSRSFGIVSTNKKLVTELLRLVAADATRQPFTGEEQHLVVSPGNSRARLAAFLGKARSELLIYDPNVSDDSMIRILKERARAGVAVRIIGKLEKKWRGDDIDVAPSAARLHVRAIIRDRSSAFVGSQSLRKLELERRREVGILFHDTGILRRLVDTFEADWNLSTGADLTQPGDEVAASRVTRRPKAARAPRAAARKASRASARRPR